MAIRVILLMIVLFPSILPAQESVSKCGTWRNVERVRRNVTSKEFKTTVTRPVKQKNILSPKGLFRIHYDTTGNGAPAMVTANGTPIAGTYHLYADSVASIFDQVHSIETGTFGYPAPAQDGILGGGSEYDVYLENLGVGSYGYVNFDDDVNLTPGKTNPQFPCYIVIDNGFESGYYTMGLNGVRVTAAHEFHHMIEVTTSGVWYDDFYFYEMSATAMESTVFPAVRDYLQYVKTYYNNFHAWPLFLQTQGTGYERAVFPKYLMEKFGAGMMNDIWSEVRTNRPVNALQNALHKHSTSLEREFSEFSFWNYYTNSRSDSNRYFLDAQWMPPLVFYSVDSITAVPVQKQSSLKPFTLQYLRILSKKTKVDTVDFIVANTNYAAALAYDFTVTPFSLSVSPFAQESYQTVMEGVYAKLTTPNSSVVTMNTVLKGGIVKRSGLSLFPNPFNPETSSLLVSMENLTDAGETRLTIYSAVDMDLVYSQIAEYTSFSGMQYAEWKGRDYNGKLVPSGIYLFTLSRGSSFVKGKFAVIR